MVQEKMTIERFAEIINAGLKTTTSKEDIKEVRSEVMNLHTARRQPMRRGRRRKSHHACSPPEGKPHQHKYWWRIPSNPRTLSSVMYNARASL